MLYKFSFNTLSRAQNSYIKHAFGLASAHPMMPLMGLTTTTLVAVQTYKDKLYFALERLMIPVMALMGPTPVDMPAAFQQVQSFSKHMTYASPSMPRPIANTDAEILPQRMSSHLTTNVPIEIAPAIASSLTTFHNVSAASGVQLSSINEVGVAFKPFPLLGGSSFDGFELPNHYNRPPEHNDPTIATGSYESDYQAQKIAEKIVEEPLAQAATHTFSSFAPFDFHMLKAEAFYEFLKISLSLSDGLRSIKGCPDCSQMNTERGKYFDLIFGNGLEGNISLDGLHTLRKVAMYFKLVHSLQDEFIWAKGSSYSEDDWSRPRDAFKTYLPAIQEVKEHMQRLIHEKLASGVYVPIKAQLYVEQLGEINFDYDDLWMGKKAPKKKTNSKMPHGLGEELGKENNRPPKAQGYTHGFGSSNFKQEDRFQP